MSPLASLLGSTAEWTRWCHPRFRGCLQPTAARRSSTSAAAAATPESSRRRVVEVHRVRGCGACPARWSQRTRRRDRSARAEATWSLWNRRASSTLRHSRGELVDERRQVRVVAQQPHRLLVAEHRPQHLGELRLRARPRPVPRAGVLRGVDQHQPRRVEHAEVDQLQHGTGAAQQLGVERRAREVDAVVHPVEPVRRPREPQRDADGNEHDGRDDRATAPSGAPLDGRLVDPHDLVGHRHQS